MLGIDVSAAKAPAVELFNPPIIPEWEAELTNGSMYVGYYDDGEIIPLESYTIRWLEVGQQYFNVAVKILTGSPNPSGTEAGTMIYPFTEKYNDTSLKVSLNDAAGKWVKVFVQAVYPDGTDSGCHFYFEVSEEETSSLSKPSITVSSIGSSDSLKVSWNKITGASGYYIYRSTKTTSSSFKLVKTIQSGSTTSWTDSGLEADTRYYYKVKAFNSKTESSLSSYDYEWTDEETSGAKFAHEPTLDLSISGNYLGSNVYGTYYPGDTIYFKCTANYTDHVYVEVNSEQLVFWLPNGIQRNYGTFVEKTSESTSENKTYTNGKEFEIHIPVPEGIQAGDYTISVTATDGVFDPNTNSSIPGTSYYNTVKDNLTIRIGTKPTGGGNNTTVTGQEMADLALSLVGSSKVDLDIYTSSTKKYDMPTDWCAPFVAYCANLAGLCGNDSIFRNIDEYSGAFPHLTHANPACLLNPGKADVYYYYKKGETYYKANGTQIKWSNTWTSSTCYPGKDVNFFMDDFTPQYLTDRTDYEPVPGDLIFIKKSNGTPWAHVGIITDYNSSTQTITFVDGNNNGNGTWKDGEKATSGTTGSNAYNEADNRYVNKLTYKLTNEAVMAIAHPYYADEVVEIPNKPQGGMIVGRNRIFGSITSYGSASDNVKIQLLDEEDNVVDTITTISGSYEFEVAPGTYTLKVNKTKHCTREYTIIVSDSNIEQDVKICLVGDVTGDGKVNNKDSNRIKKHINETEVLTGYEFKCADVIVDGKVNNKDSNRIKKHINETEFLW